MPTFKVQIEAKQDGIPILHPDNWQEFDAEDQRAAAIAALHTSGRIAELLPCTISVSEPLTRKLLFHSNGAPAVVHSFDFVRTN